MVAARKNRPRRLKPEAMTTGQVARLCGVGQGLVKSWCDGGHLEHSLLPSGHRLVHWRDLLAFSREHGLTHVVGELAKLEGAE